MDPWRSFYFLGHVQNSGDFWPIMNLNFSKALADNRVLADIIVVQPRVTCLLTFPSAVQMMVDPSGTGQGFPLCPWEVCQATLSEIM